MKEKLEKDAISVDDFQKKSARNELETKRRLKEEIEKIKNTEDLKEPEEIEWSTLAHRINEDHTIFRQKGTVYNYKNSIDVGISVSMIAI